MKNRMARSLRTAVLLALTLALLAGCGRKPGASADSVTAAPAAGTVTEPTPDPAPTSAPGEDAVTVRSTEELLEAIRPGATIIVQPGRYDMSEYVEELRAQRIFDAWSEAHPYVALRDCFDGVEIVIRNADGLTLSGGTEDAAGTELVIEPRYATVLCFENCRDLTLETLTLGHTDGADCSGNVVGLFGCTGATLRALDLYGCGVYGVEAGDGSGDLRVVDSTIRDCELGPFDIDGCTGAIRFENCDLTGSGYGGYYSAPSAFGASQLSFAGCRFGTAESNEWFFREDAECEDCVWSEITQYPEYPDIEPEMPTFDPEAITELSFTVSPLADTYWNGYMTVDPQSGESRMLPYTAADSGVIETVTLFFAADGSGWYADWTGTTEFTWDYAGESLACLTEAEGRNSYASLYADTIEEGMLWLMLQRDNAVIWLY